MTSRRLLGWFVLFQLVYIPGANVLKLFPATVPPRRDEFDDNIQLPGTLRVSALQPLLDGVVAASDRWGELTGQTQGWALFAPYFAPQSALPRVVLRWDDGREVVRRSEFEPSDPDHYFRPPEPSCRLYNSEYRMALVYWSWSEQSFADHRAEWRQKLLDRVRIQRRSIQAFLRWHVRHYRHDHPNAAMPDEVELRARLVPAPPIDGGPRGPIVEKPIAKWRPNDPPDPGLLPLEAFDLAANRWVRLAAEES